MVLTDLDYMQLMARTLLTSTPSNESVDLEMTGLALAGLLQDFDQRTTLRRRSMLPLHFGIAQARMLRRMVCFLRGARAESACKVWRQKPLGEGLALPWSESCQRCRLKLGRLDVVCGTLFPVPGVVQALESNSPAQESTVSKDQLSGWLSGVKPVPIRAMHMPIRSLASRNKVLANTASASMELVDAYLRLSIELRRVIKELMRQWDRMTRESKTAMVTWTSSDPPTIKFVPSHQVDPLLPVDLEQFPWAEESSDFIQEGGRSFCRKAMLLQALPVVYDVRITPFPLSIDEENAWPRWCSERRALRLFVRPAVAREEGGGQVSSPHWSA